MAEHDPLNNQRPDAPTTRKNTSDAGSGLSIDEIFAQEIEAAEKRRAAERHKRKAQEAARAAKEARLAEEASRGREEREAEADDVEALESTALLNVAAPTPPEDTPHAAAQAETTSAEHPNAHADTTQVLNRPETPLLSSNEVAAVSVDQPDYDVDTPSPYLNEKRATMSTQEIRAQRRRRGTIALIACFAVVVVAGIAVAHSYFGRNRGSSVEQFNTAKIKRGEFLETIAAHVALEPVHQQQVVPEVSGTLSEVNVAENDEVKEGDVLFVLENQSVVDEEAEAKSKLEEATSTTEARADDLQRAEDDLSEVKQYATDTETKLDELLSLPAGTMAQYHQVQIDLAEAQNNGANEADIKSLQDQANALQSTISSAVNSLPTLRQFEYAGNNAALNTAYIQVDTRQKTYDDAKTAHDEAQKAQDSAQSAYDSAHDKLEKLNVRATISGVVHNLQDLETGAELDTSAQLCTVDDISAYAVYIPVSADDLSRTEAGQEVRISVDAYPDLAITTTVDDISTTGSQALAKATIQEPDERLQLGDAAYAQIVTTKMEDVLMVPLEALTKKDDGSYALDVLLDPSRAIVTTIDVSVVAQNDTTAVVEAPNIQADTSVVLGGTEGAQQEGENT
ncbi:MAG: efflux RND transporter periplasmic adaptor subunit [Atopobiaceae bacterium]|jgi:multidrug efflux pump subunit AcrA (membrane-fusion protein)